MSEHHSHEHHDHSSHEHIPQDKKILALSFAIITGFMIVEFIGGYWFMAKSHRDDGITDAWCGIFRIIGKPFRCKDDVKQRS